MHQDIIALLNEMTKEEIIDWLRNQPAVYFRKTLKSDLLFYRWERRSAEISKKQADHVAKWASLSMKKRDGYAKRFNESTDIKEKLELLKKMKPYDDQLQQMIREGQALDKEEEAVGRLYEQIAAARQEEAIA